MSTNPNNAMIDTIIPREITWRRAEVESEPEDEDKISPSYVNSYWHLDVAYVEPYLPNQNYKSCEIRYMNRDGYEDFMRKKVFDSYTENGGGDNHIIIKVYDEDISSIIRVLRIEADVEEIDEND